MTKNPIRIAVSILALLVFLFAVSIAHAAPTILQVDGGGTGWRNFQSGSVLLGNGVNPIASTTRGNVTGTGITVTGGTNAILGSGLSLVLDLINLASGVTGTLPVANGGTGVASFGGTNRVLFTPTVNQLSSASSFTYDGTTLSAPLVAATQAGNATSTFAGNVQVTGNLRVDGQFYAPVSLVTSGNTTINGTLTSTGTSTSPAFAASGLGAVGAPAFTFSSDLNTGLWSPTADTLALSTAGAERVRIDSAGNVGIGTTSPSTRLNIYGTGATDLLRIDASQYNFSTRLNGESVVINNGYTGGGWARGLMTFENSAGTDYFSLGGYGSGQTLTYAFIGPAYNDTWQTWLPNGNIGIGDTTTTYDSLVSKVSILSAKTANNAGQLALVDSTAQAAGVGGTVGFLGKYTDAGGYALGAKIAAQKLNSTTGDYGFDLGFWTRQNGSSLAQKMVLTSTGNVGIGTTTPTKKLSVAGTVAFDGLTASIGAGSLCLTSGKEVVYNAGSDNCLSSTRASKHDIQDFSLEDFSVLEQLQPASFVYNDDVSGTMRYGFIAEDAAAAEPRLATRNASGEISGLDTNAFLAVIVDALKKVISRQDDTDARLEALEARLAALESENATLRTGRVVLACMLP